MLELDDGELIVLFKNGDEEAFALLLVKYNPLIWKIAREYYGLGYDSQDFYQVGSMAFLNAVKSFEESKGYIFFSYALSCVRNGIVSKYRSLASKVEYAFEGEKLELVMESKSDYVLNPIDVSGEELEGDNYYAREKWIHDCLMNEELLTSFERSCLQAYLMGKRYDVIADSLGVSNKQVDNALSRCKKKLKDLRKELKF